MRRSSDERQGQKARPESTKDEALRFQTNITCKKVCYQILRLGLISSFHYLRRFFLCCLLSPRVGRLFPASVTF